MDDLKNHFKMGYSPSNATMVVTGDVTLDEIVALAQKYIEPIPSNPAAAQGHDEGAGAAGRAPRRRPEVRAAADPDDGLPRAGDGPPRLLPAAGARDHPVLRPEFAHVQAPRRQGPAGAVGERRRRLVVRPDVVHDLGAAEGRRRSGRGREGDLRRTRQGRRPTRSPTKSSRRRRTSCCRASTARSGPSAAAATPSAPTRCSSATTRSCSPRPTTSRR